MKKLLLILGVVFFLYSFEWVNVNSKDYKLVKIDTIQGIVVADGYYDVINDSIINYLGGAGNYFFYTGQKKNITLTDEMIDNLKGIKKE